ncbi:MAG: D-aminoacyl-tRNA deacylase [Thermoplasmata archaeon]|nr:D-aminoacyl-tRNA deacylase [Thermoplasmata archaeon]
MSASSEGTRTTTRYLVVVSEGDPLATLIAESWGTPPSVGEFIDGAALRLLAPDVELLRRPGLHIHDAHLGRALPPRLRSVPLVFPSRHRSESGIGCLTVHALGNFGPSADVGGEPGRLVPTAARLMADALRQAAEPAGALGIPATYEATHHGPLVHQPAFFSEIADSLSDADQREAAVSLSAALADLTEDPADRVVIGVGGGHYAPHFTGLALSRHWAFGHILPRYALEQLSPEILRQLKDGGPPPEGALFQRAADADRTEWKEWGPRLHDSDAPPRPTGGP